MNISMITMAFIIIIFPMLIGPAFAEQVVVIPKKEFNLMMQNVDKLKLLHMNESEQIDLYVSMAKDLKEIIQADKEYIKLLESRIDTFDGHVRSCNDQIASNANQIEDLERWNKVYKYTIAGMAVAMVILIFY